MDPRRPDPDALLANLNREEERRSRGRLKIFFGAAPGVGKTYSMLEAAREQQRQGRDLLVGLVETHRRPETELLLAGLPVLPRGTVVHRGHTLHEFDLEGALRRRPWLILVDELAHANAPGSRHRKRWQDVVELLDAGINVYTTVNVQHVESLIDLVAQITGVTVRETIPDSIMEQADEVELVDLPPDALLQRLREGKVYLPDQAQRAVENFFRKGNLLALRELALRKTAERVDAEMRSYKQVHGIADTWPAVERFLVCVGPNPLSARLIRATRRMAAIQRAEWIAAYVETPGQIRLTEAARAQVAQNLRLAEQLGGETVILSGEDVAGAILQHARTRNVTRIVVGKPTHPRWRDRLYGSLLDSVVRGSGEIDVYAIRGEAEEEGSAPTLLQRARQRWPAYLWCLATVAGATAVSAAMYRRFELADIAMIYLAGVVFVAIRFGQRPSVLASILSVSALDFFFVPPRLTFAVADLKHLVTFAVMICVGLITGTLAKRLRRSVEVARDREQRTAALYRLSRVLSAETGLEVLAEAAVRYLEEVFETPAAILLPDAEGRLQCAGPREFVLDERERSVAQWVLDLARPAGPGTDTLPGARAQYLPLKGTRGMIGVLGLVPAGEGHLAHPEQQHLLEAFAHQIAVSLERALLAREAEQARLAVERERLRDTLLSSVSHDLRTPLAVITGAASSLLEAEGDLDPATRRDLLGSIHEEAEHLNRLVRNLLDMTRLESGSLTLQLEWASLEEIVGEALGRLERRIQEREIRLNIPADLPLVRMDGVLITQVLVNLVENALKYTPAGSPIEISAALTAEGLRVEVADGGPGLAPGAEEQVFDKFFRITSTTPSGGVGLGLSICRGLIEAHGGRIWAENRPGGGAAFTFLLPVSEGPPPTEAEKTPGEELAT